MGKSLAYRFIKLQWERGKLTSEQVQSLALCERPLITQSEADEIVAMPQG